VLHLARRFAGSLWPIGPSAADDAWATHHLTAGEVLLWRRMKGFDRRHAVGVAQRVSAALGSEATRAVMAAALLHDVGKVESGLGVSARVVATVRAAALGAARAAEGHSRMARYTNHPAIGAALLRDAGADPLTIAWAAEHHLPPSDWTVAEGVAGALKDADDD
jgi:hypothetical protein